jgi:3-hydroxyisobutyrate dehydrogenase-like beta-hydroxyacid dehydrogenase
MASTSKLKVGFIGASGMMGHGIAKNILAKGHPLALTVHRNAAAVKDLLAAGATQAESAAALAASSDVVFICVTGSPEVQQQFAGPQGLLAGGRKGLYIVDCSTSEPDSTASLREAAKAKGMVLVDAPLARTPVEAEEGRLNVIIGASAEDYRTLEPVLRTFAENVFHVGDAGAGHIVKLLNNFIAQAICTAAAEAFAVGAKAGIDPRKLVEVVSAGGVNSGLFQAMGKTLAGDLQGLKFGLDNARKDVRYYTHLAESNNVPSVVGEAVHQTLCLASALGYGGEFVPSLVRAQERVTGVKLVH